LHFSGFSFIQIPQTPISQHSISIDYNKFYDSQIHPSSESHAPTSIISSSLSPTFDHLDYCSSYRSPSIARRSSNSESTPLLPHPSSSVAHLYQGIGQFPNHPKISATPQPVSFLAAGVVSHGGAYAPVDMAACFPQADDVNARLGAHHMLLLLPVDLLVITRVHNEDSERLRYAYMSIAAG